MQCAACPVALFSGAPCCTPLLPIQCDVTGEATTSSGCSVCTHQSSGSLQPCICSMTHQACWPAALTCAAGSACCQAAGASDDDFTFSPVQGASPAGTPRSGPLSPRFGSLARQLSVSTSFTSLGLHVSQVTLRVMHAPVSLIVCCSSNDVLSSGVCATSQPAPCAGYCGPGGRPPPPPPLCIRQRGGLPASQPPGAASPLRTRTRHGAAAVCSGATRHNDPSDIACQRDVVTRCRLVCFGTTILTVSLGGVGLEEQRTAGAAEGAGPDIKLVPGESAAATSSAASLPGAWATFGDNTPSAPASPARSQPDEAPSAADSTGAEAQPQEARAMPSAAHLPPEAAGAAEPVADAAPSGAGTVQDAESQAARAMPSAAHLPPEAGGAAEPIADAAPSEAETQQGAQSDGQATAVPSAAHLPPDSAGAAEPVATDAAPSDSEAAQDAESPAATAMPSAAHLPPESAGAPEPVADAATSEAETAQDAASEEARAMPSAAHLPPESAGAPEPVADAATSEAETAQDAASEEARAMPSAAHLPPEAAGAADPVADAAPAEVKPAEEAQSNEASATTYAI